MATDKFGREMHKVTCSECGQETEVPFKPDGERPVYCRDCFMKQREAKRGGASKPRAEKPAEEPAPAPAEEQAEAPAAEEQAEAQAEEAPAEAEEPKAEEQKKKPKKEADSQ